MIASNKRGYKSEINITPYIDILLVMLIIFMVATPIRKHDLPVRAPLDVLHDLVAMPLAGGQRERDLQDDGRERQVAAGVHHATIRLERIVER